MEKTQKDKKEIITAAEARAISEVNKSTGLNSIMDRVEEYAVQGKKEFEIRNKPLFKQWEAELVCLGYVLRKQEDGIWVLSWDNNYYNKIQSLEQNIIVPHSHKEEILLVDNDTFSNFQKMVMNKGVSQTNYNESPLKFTYSFLEYVGINIWEGDKISIKLHIYTKK